MARKKKRAPGGGRKPLDPDVTLSDPVKVRLERAQLKDLEKLASKHGLGISAVVRAAVTSWILRHRKHRGHIEALACMVSLLAAEIERSTGKRWIVDPETGAAVGEGVEQLIFHFAPTPVDSVTIPEKVRAIAGGVITMIENAAPLPKGMHWHADMELRSIRRELGSGWERNQARWRRT